MASRIWSVGVSLALLLFIASNLDGSDASFSVGSISLNDAKLSVQETGISSPDAEILFSLGETSSSSITATHLQKLKLSFSVKQANGESFTPQQVFLKLTHESGISHDYIVFSRKKGGLYEFELNLLENMEKLYYLSGRYSLELLIGDSAIDNSIFWKVADVELDLPVAPDSAPKPPPPQPSLEARFKPKEEIDHIFRAPEKRPPVALSLTFLAFTLLPLIGLIIGLILLNVNLKAFPTSGVPLLAALAFHGGLATILTFYVTFWIKLNLFFTLKAVLALALLTAIPGHVLLSSLANSSFKVKEA